MWGLVLLWGCTGCPTETPDESGQDLHVPSLLLRAHEALQQKAILTGLALTDSAAYYDPDLPDIYFLRGRLFFELHQLDKAEAAYQHALSLQPEYPGIWHNLGNVYYRRKQFQQALTHYHRETRLHPAPRPWHAMGGAYWKLGQLDSARWAYEQATTLDSQYAPVWASLAEWYESAGMFETALRHATTALELDSTNIDYRYTVGAMLVRTQQPEAALHYLRTVVQEQPWNYSALFSLGQALQHLGQSEMAQQTLDHANRVRREQAEVERMESAQAGNSVSFTDRIAYADALRRTGRMAEALQAYHVALNLQPTNLALRNNIATLYMQRGDSTEALVRYRQILEEDSTFADTWLNLALYYARKGQKDRAEQSLQTAFQYGTDSPAVQAFRERMTNQ